VEFTFNGSAALSNLTVSRVMDKNYTNAANEPLWGVEKANESQNFNISDIDLLWGLVDDSYSNDSTVEMFRGKELYLPVAYEGRVMSSFRDNLAAATVFTAAWNHVYQWSSWISGTSIGDTPSYSGESQYALFLKWRELSRSPGGASKILDLIWTDLVASAVVGTKTGFEADTASESATVGGLGKREVYKHRNAVIYTNFLFAIPAFIALGLWTLLLIVAILLLVSRKVTCNILRHHMNQTSLGRAVLDAAHPDRQIAISSTSEWLNRVGNKTLNIRQYQGKESPPRLDSEPVYRPQPVEMNILLSERDWRSEWDVAQRY
jgi:hypothetical protein